MNAARESHTSSTRGPSAISNSGLPGNNFALPNDMDFGKSRDKSGGAKKFSMKKMFNRSTTSKNFDS
tara:strand:- start:663 stop:863 length:201 start_codon:yes stop_codon:yes gene_type:complete